MKWHKCPDHDHHYHHSHRLYPIAFAIGLQNEAIVKTSAITALFLLRFLHGDKRTSSFSISSTAMAAKTEPSSGWNQCLPILRFRNVEQESVPVLTERRNTTKPFATTVAATMTTVGITFSWLPCVHLSPVVQ